MASAGDLDRISAGGRRVVLLPSHGRMASVSLNLSQHDIFRLPVAAAARYEALTELSLCGPSFDEVAAPGGGRTLGDFVSSCCPRLRKLDICAPTGMPQLVIRSDTLEDLRLLLAEDLRMLDVTAPSMRVLKLQLCFQSPTPLEDSEDEQVTNNLVRIAAPRLEEIGMSTFTLRERPELDLQDTARASVRRLSDIRLDMHGPYCCDKDGGLWLLENCPGVEHVVVSIGHVRGFAAATSRHLVDLTEEGAAPFASVRSMVVKAGYFSDGHHMVSSISSLLSRCPHLRSLTIDITGTERSYAWMCFCYDDTWKLHRKFSLRSLEEVTIRGFLGADEDMELLTLLFEGSNSIRSLTLRAITRFPGHITLERMMAEDGEKDTESIVQKLMKIPCTDRGYWHFGKDATWTSHATEK
ncbi:unnamed protein product [Urochloa decumbens]|uniref:FBD domain-containing protein n=1 Tax=Urochloa decumbens TaxID=240449 RepID=A0ABC9GXQ5_9POAL